MALKQWSWIQQAPCSSALIHHSTLNKLINPDRTCTQPRRAGREGMKFHYDPVTASVLTTARWMPLVFVFLNDSCAVLDTENEYPYISLFCLATFEFALM